MKMNYGDIYMLYDSLKRMGEVSNINTAYAIAMTLASVKTIAEFVENQRDRIIRKYGVTEDGMRYTFPDEVIPEFNKEMEELLSKEADVDITQVDAKMEDFQADGVRAKDYVVAMQYLVRKGGDSESKE